MCKINTFEVICVIDVMQLVFCKRLSNRFQELNNVFGEINNKINKLWHKISKYQQNNILKLCSPPTQLLFQ